MFRLLLSSVKSIGRYRVLSHALVTNTVFGVVLRGIGDVIQQSIERKQTSEKLKKKIAKNNENELSNGELQLQIKVKPFDGTRTSLSFIDCF